MTKYFRPAQIESIADDNRSFENAGVAFVKGANDSYEFFEKINKE